MPSVAVVSHGSPAGATRVAHDADLSSFDVIAADADHLSGVLRRVIRENLSAAVLPLTGDAKADTKALRKPPKASRRPVLAIADSALAARQYGFWVGLGGWFHAADLRRAGSLKALRGAVSSVEATVVVDGDVIGGELTLAGVSTGPRFPMKMRAPGPPGPDEICFLWNNLDAPRLFSNALSLMRGKNLPSHKTGAARRVVFDLAGTGYCLDGALHTADAPRVVAVTRGPDVLVCG